MEKLLQRGKLNKVRVLDAWPGITIGASVARQPGIDFVIKTRKKKIKKR